MDDILKKIKYPILEELKIFEKELITFSNTKITLLNNITNFVLNKRGKLIRPIIIFLVAKMLNGNINKKTYLLALIIEILHIATLIHDDVIDNSNIRRGFFSLKALWKNKIAVLTGDYLISNCLLLAIKHNYYDLINIICNTIIKMSEGEFLQIEKYRILNNVTENIYNKIIYYKTALLIGICCEGSAYSINENKNTIIDMKKFGELIGMAFQIKDDLLDYESNNNVLGKPIFMDLKEKKITLPLIYTLKICSDKDKKKLNLLINNCYYNKNINYVNNNINNIINIVNKYGGINYAKNRMIFFHKKALKILNKYPNNNIKNSLKELTYFIIERKN
ncbi:MAG: polyprenyl synthetase family protein [Candidatus Bostrichicola ureolyticus]|nr:MAG: polyprenyl synthetase family protein [Candidatus Bostrichicola ureolyticus]